MSQRIVKVSSIDPHGNLKYGPIETTYYIFPTGIVCATEQTQDNLISVFFVDEGPTTDDITIKYFIEHISRSGDEIKIQSISGRDAIKMIDNWKKRLNVKITGDEIKLLDRAKILAGELINDQPAKVDDLTDHLQKTTMGNDLTRDEEDLDGSLSDDSLTIITDDPGNLIGHNSGNERPSKKKTTNSQSKKKIANSQSKKTKDDDNLSDESTEEYIRRHQSDK